MKVLVFDTETTGLPKYGAKLPNVNDFPCIVQFSWLVYDDATMKITNIAIIMAVLFQDVI